MEGRRVVLNAAYWIAVGGSRKSGRQIRLALFRVQSKGEATADPMLRSTLPRKTSKHKRNGSVPQTDTGGRVEKTKANE
jgi:hypothetical protein